MDTITVEREKYRKGRNGRIYYDGKAVFSVDGRLVMPKSLPAESCMIHMSHLGTEGYLVADDILFMRDIPEERIKLSECEGPHIRSISIDGTKMDYLYLSPSILTPVKFRKNKR